MRHAGPIALLALAVACGTLDDETRRIAPPANRCPEFDCSAYVGQMPRPTCQAGVCEVSQQVDDVLVVSVPQTSLFAPGQVFAIRSSDFFTRATPKCKGRKCIVLPALGNVDGVYLVNPAGAAMGGRVLGNPSGFTSLPVRVTMRPLWSPLPSDRPSDAVDLGVPLETIFGITRIPSYPSPPPGPGGGPSIEYRVSVPAGQYERTLAPIEPFEDAFPPDIRIVTAPATKYDDVTFATDSTTLKSFTFPVSRPDGDLEGFTAEFVETVSGHRVSTIARLHAGDASAVVRLLRVTGAEERGLDLRLAPPARTDALPVLSYAFVAGATPPIRYPTLPTPVTIEGSVGGRTSEDLPPQATAATLEFESYEIQTTGKADLTENLSLRYVRRVSTDGAGHYSVRLPPGRYKATIIPRDPEHVEGAPTVPMIWAKNVSEDVRVAETPSVQYGRFLGLRPAVVARGVCRMTDGRPLAGAVVVARPAAALALPPVAPATRPASPATYPREALGTTDTGGAFQLALDPGRYDVTIQPAPGTRLPWVVLSARLIGNDPVDLGVISIPAPIAAGLTIHDPNDNPILRALVRAFAVPPGGTVAVRVGEAMTDADGRFEMDLAVSPR